MEIAWEEHQGKKILKVDYKGILLDSDMVAHLNKAVSMLKAVDKNEKLRFYSDVTGCFATPGFMEAAKLADKELHKIYTVKSAIIGIKGAKAILLKAYNLVAKAKVVPVQTKEEAIEYLAKE